MKFNDEKANIEFTLKKHKLCYILILFILTLQYKQKQKHMRLSIKDAKRCVGCQSCMFACTRRSGQAGLSNSCIGIKSQGGMSNGFSVIICRSCYNPPCAAVCSTGALTEKPERGVVFNSSKCIGCGNCKNACIVKAVFWNETENKPAICVHCGYCVKFCPHNVLETIKE